MCHFSFPILHITRSLVIDLIITISTAAGFCVQLVWQIPLSRDDIVVEVQVFGYWVHSEPLLALIVFEVGLGNDRLVFYAYRYQQIAVGISLLHSKNLVRYIVSDEVEL